MKFWQMSLISAGIADVYILGEIVSSGYEWSDSDTSAATFKKDLDALGDVETINLHINSPGGSVFDGSTIGSMIKQHKATVNVYIDGLAASIASVIAMAGDNVYMPKNAMLMIHNPWTFAIGNANDLRKQAEDLDKIGLSMQESYLGKSKDKLSAEKLQELLDNETWLSASEALEYGFADEILEENQVAANVSQELFAKYKNVPAKLQLKAEKKEEKVISLTQRKINLLKENEK